MHAYTLFPEEIETMHAVVMDHTKTNTVHIPTSEEILFCWPNITMDRRITWRMIRARTCYSPYWIYARVFDNPNVSLDIVVANLNYPWDWDMLSEHPDIPVIFKLQTPHLPWNYTIISWHYATLALMTNHSWLNWDLDAIVRSDRLTKKWLIGLAHLPWNYRRLSRCRFVDIEVLRALPHADWDWDMLSGQIKLMDILVYFRLNWNFAIVARHPRMTCELMLRNSQIPWQYEWVPHLFGHISREAFYQALAERRKTETCPTLI
jgi:hypothetical protein